MQMFFEVTRLDLMTYKHVIMILLGCFFAFLAIKKKFEPLLLLPLAFGIIIANIPGAGLSAYDATPYYAYQLDEDGNRVLDDHGNPIHILDEDGNRVPVLDEAGNPIIERRGLLNFLYGGILYVIYPPLVFLCIGAMTDFGPLLASPRSTIVALGGQLGIFIAFGASIFFASLLAPYIPGLEPFSLKEAASIAIIGSSDGPTSIYSASRLAPHLLPSIAIAAFSYMALVPFIQPPIMRWLTTDKERVVVMPDAKNVSKTKKIIFPIALTAITLLLVPAAGALIGMLSLGNLLRESGVTERYVKTLSSHALNFLTLMVALSIGSSTAADRFLTPQTLIIISCGLIAFVFGTIGGVLCGKLLYKITKGKVNPLIGNSGVSAMPMAARISQRLGQQYNPQNHLLMHAMGPIVASTVGSAIIAGLFLSFFMH